MIITGRRCGSRWAAAAPTCPRTTRSSAAWCISAAISKYIYISINRTFTDDYFLKYSAARAGRQAAEIEHPIVREALLRPRRRPRRRDRQHRRHPVRHRPGLLRLVHRRLLQAVHAMQRNHVCAADLGREACEIEIDRLGRPVGKQDQYVAAFGGITRFDFEPGRLGRRRAAPAVGGDLLRPRRAPADVLHRLLPRRRQGARGAA